MFKSFSKLDFRPRKKNVEKQTPQSQLSSSSVGVSRVVHIPRTVETKKRHFIYII